MVADMELTFIKDRQRAGIEAARAEGVYKGRKKNIDDDEIRRGSPGSEPPQPSWRQAVKV
ncbi:hypothetical protein POM99_14550, partial [Novosphingobium sp. HBC54]|nr:hypothetical protein [Novosphingobium cyanobacteriorum]